MTILIAPDSFKNTMTNTEAAEIIAGSIRASLPEAQFLLCPMADGGEGTAATLTRANQGRTESITVTGPLGDPVGASFGLSADGKTAYFEMAAASGIELVSSENLNPLRATTWGTGEVLSELARRGIKEVILGIGGSATVDGGAGMAQALGYRFLDEQGRELPRGTALTAELPRLAALDDSAVSPAVKALTIRVACDVTNPLLGPRGAAPVYGPQKGAAPEMIPRLEEGLAALSRVWQKTGLVKDTDQPGDGAAGGLGAGLRAFCGAKILPGAALVAEAAGFDTLLRQADILITGEGKTDSQTASGKLCAVLAGKARKVGVPVILISGALMGSPEDLEKTFDIVFSTTPGTIPLEEALASAREDLSGVARGIGKLLALRN